MVSRVRNGSRLIAFLAALGLACVFVAGHASAQGRFDFHWTLKAGRQSAENSGDTLFKDFEAVHGDLVEDREVQTEGFEFDLLTFPSRNAGVGMGFEYLQYFKVFHFQDPAGVKPSGVLNLKARALLYTLKFYWRLGPLLPYFGIGSGIYVVNYSENALPPFLESSTEVIHGRVGSRILMGKWSLLLEYGQTQAPLNIQTRPNMPELELGGVYTSLGIGRSF